MKLPEQFESKQPTVAGIINEAMEKARDRGMKSEQARQYAHREVRLAGFYKTPRGWTRLTGDLRNKVNVREATKQPDGTFVICDVDVFYPNAVKGHEEEDRYTSEQIEQICENTNRAIEAGGQAPGLIEGHPNPFQQAMGSQAESHGIGVNWRISPRGKGWARCDLVKVDPAIVRRLQKGKLPGLSARINQDAGGLNKRFGHVALLGGDLQALSHLPTHEIFAASQVCFSAAVAGQTPSKDFFMKTKSECYAAMAHAYASKEAGEPDADAKVEEAKKMFAALGDGGDDVTSAPPPAPPAPDDNAGGDTAGNPAPQFEADFAGLEGLDPAGDAAGGEQTPEAGGGAGGAPAFSAETQLPEEPKLTGNNATLPQKLDFAAQATETFVNDPVAAFQQVAKLAQTIAGQNAMLQKKVFAAETRERQATNRLRTTEFVNEVNALRKSGRILPDNKVLEAQFKQCFSSANPGEAIKGLISFLKAIPAGQTRSSTSLFDSTAANRDFSADDAESIADVVREMRDLTGKTFSADMVKAGMTSNWGMPTR